MRSILVSALALLMIAPAMPVSATHGDTAYVIGVGFPFIAESYYVGGPGYLDQYWDFVLVSTGGPDRCMGAHGGWDPHPITGGTPGFTGGCTSGASLAVGGIDHYHPYPNGANGCAPVPACQGLDIHDITASYDGQTFDAKLVICDNRVNPTLNRLSGSYCNDLLLMSQLI